MERINKINWDYFEKLKKKSDISIVFLNLCTKILNDKYKEIKTINENENN